MKPDVFGARSTLTTSQGPVTFFRLSALAKAGVAPGLDHLPCSIKILLEAVLRSGRVVFQSGECVVVSGKE